MSQADYAGLIAQLKADISAEYSTSKTYKVGDYCLYGADGVLYICKIAVTTAGAFDSNKWQAISFGEAVGDLVIADDTQPTSLANKIWLDTDPNPDTVEVITEEDLGNIVAGEFDSASAYAVGDYCIHDAKLYVAKTATAVNDGWIAARWQQVTVMGTINDQVGELKTQIDTLKGGCADGTEVLKGEIDYEIGDDLKTLNIEAPPRTAKYANGMLIYKYESSIAGTGSISANFTNGNSGITTGDDVWIAFNKSANQFISFEYDLGLDGVSATNAGQSVSISFALRYKLDSDNEIHTVNYQLDVTKTHESVNMSLAEFMRGILTVAHFNHLTHIALYGITSNNLTRTNGIIVDLYIKGVYVRSEDGDNLAEKYAYVKTKAESAESTATNAYELANSNKDHIDVLEADVERIDAPVDGDDIISDSTYTLRQNLPSYYTSDPANPTSFSDFAYIDSKIESIPDADKRFVFFTDSHWDHPQNGRHSPELIQYVRQRKSIPNVIFGGDYIEVKKNSGDIKGKYLAKQVIEDFTTKMLCTAGSSYLPVMGNHDTNMASVEGGDEGSGNDEPIADSYDVFFPYTQIQKTQFANIHKNAHTQFEYELERKGEAWLRTFAGDYYEEFAAFLKLSYYYDDVKHKIRYIVLNSGAAEPSGSPSAETPIPAGPIRTIFSSDNSAPPICSYINLLWYYDTLHDTPENYDVVIAIHELIAWPSTEGSSVTAGAQTKLVTMAMGLKTKSNRGIYYSLTNGDFKEKMMSWWGWDSLGRKYFDFTDANTVGKVVFVCGHIHRDKILIFSQCTDGSQATLPEIEVAADQSDVTVDQTTIQMPSSSVNNFAPEALMGCDIPAIFTNRDKTTPNVPGDASSGYTTGTVNEQIFDVIGFTENAIEITRIGKGDNRHITFE